MLPAHLPWWPLTAQCERCSETKHLLPCLLECMQCSCPLCLSCTPPAGSRRSEDARKRLTSVLTALVEARVAVRVRIEDPPRRRLKFPRVAMIPKRAARVLPDEFAYLRMGGAGAAAEEECVVAAIVQRGEQSTEYPSVSLVRRRLKSGSYIKCESRSVLAASSTLASPSCQYSATARLLSALFVEATR